MQHQTAVDWRSATCGHSVLWKVKWLSPGGVFL